MITNSIQVLKTQGITINTSKDKSKVRLQDTLQELNMKKIVAEENKKASNCQPSSVG